MIKSINRVLVSLLAGLSIITLVKGITPIHFVRLKDFYFDGYRYDMDIPFIFKFLNYTSNIIHIAGYFIAGYAASRVIQKPSIPHNILVAIAITIVWPLFILSLALVSEDMAFFWTYVTSGYLITTSINFFSTLLGSFVRGFLKNSSIIERITLSIVLVTLTIVTGITCINLITHPHNIEGDTIPLYRPLSDYSKMFDVFANPSIFYE